MKLIWIVEDNASFRDATERGLVALDPSLHCDTFGSCEDAVSAIEEGARPEVVFMDIGLPGMDGIEGIGEIKQRHPEVSILILTVFEDDDKIFRALRAGASGYLLKSEPITKVYESINLVIEGAAPINPRIASRVLRLFTEQPPKENDFGLTTREREVLNCMARGLVRKQTADELDLNMHTLDYVMRCIYRKMHVNCATSAVALAIRERLVPEPESHS